MLDPFAPLATAVAPPTIVQQPASKTNPTFFTSGRWFRDDFSCAEKQCFPDGAELLDRHLPPTRNYGFRAVFIRVGMEVR